MKLPIPGILILLEESGLLSRLAALTDGIFSKIGLNGRAVFSLVMGFGCTATAILTTRGLDDKHVQRRTILCLPYISCSAKLPVYLTLGSSFFPNPFLAVCVLSVLGVGGACAASMSASAFCPEILALSGETVYNENGYSDSRVFIGKLAALFF